MLTCNLKYLIINLIFLIFILHWINNWMGMTSAKLSFYIDFRTIKGDMITRPDCSYSDRKIFLG